MRDIDKLMTCFDDLGIEYKKHGDQITIEQSDGATRIHFAFEFYDEGEFFAHRFDIDSAY